jgi:MFS family permease
MARFACGSDGMIGRTEGDGMGERKKQWLLFIGLGTSTFGDFIYLVAINVFILRLTDSAAAVAGLWIMSPLAAILTQFWSGTFIDRFNKRRLLIATDLFRAVLTASIPLLESVWLIYGILFLLAVAKAFFNPASITYITKLVPAEDRKKFNAYRSLVTSGAFLIGPAISGMLLLISTPEVAILLNAVSFACSALVFFFLPDLDGPKAEKRKIHFRVFAEDWGKVLRFSRNHPYIVTIYFLAQFFMIIALGMDAQEVVFARKVVGLSESEYGLLISVTGIGYVAGSMVLSRTAQKISVRTMIAVGHLLVAAGYIIYAFSYSFLAIAAGFLLLGFFNAFSGTGVLTFFQNHFPQDMMGRISSIYGLFQSLLQILFILLIGFTGDLFPLRSSIVLASFVCLSIGLLLAWMVYHPAKRAFFAEAEARDHSAGASR